MLYVDVCVFVGVGAIRQIASEVVQYVMDLAGQSQGRHTTEADQLGTLTEPDLLTAAMVHQQHRAEVGGSFHVTNRTRIGVSLFVYIDIISLCYHWGLHVCVYVGGRSHAEKSLHLSGSKQEDNFISLGYYVGITSSPGCEMAGHLACHIPVFPLLCDERGCPFHWFFLSHLTQNMPKLPPQLFLAINMFTCCYIVVMHLFPLCARE